MYKIALEALICVCLLLVARGQALAQDSPYSGKWKLISDRSDLGQLPEKVAAASFVEVIIIKDTISVKRSFLTDGAFEETLRFEGQEKESFSPDGNTLRKSKVNWSKDKKAIVFDWYYEVGGNEWHYTRTETWNLSEDGKILTVDRITVMPEKTDKVKAVYQKQ